MFISKCKGAKDKSLARLYLCHKPTYKHLHPKDDMVLELAVASESDFIITFNEKDFRPAKDFGIKIVSAKELL